MAQWRRHLWQSDIAPQSNRPEAIDSVRHLLDISVREEVGVEEDVR